MMPARFLPPWEVLEMDIQELKQESQEENTYVLVVDRTSKLLLAYPFPSDAYLLLPYPLSCLPYGKGRNLAHHVTLSSRFFL